ncbi:MAG: kelch motif-containing protein [Gordonia sp. (in: high G+C Gram-positive bacteria)]|uniref:galactose oxidase-like domain-containing protein n=1 Tax=Gordonia sp. (in: high G+C Gram-positive bacteria) TaxID=84139 RepID=UPI0039E2AE43
MTKTREFIARWWRIPVILIALGVVGAITAPPAVMLVNNFKHEREISSPDYQAKYGRWQVIELNGGDRINAIHATMLPTGKVLLIAGSGNNVEMFEAGTYKTIVYDPSTGVVKHVETPTDMFCAGHAHLSNGNILVAGGNQGYEKLGAKMTNAGGPMTVVNEDPTRTYTIPKGTVFTSNRNGNKYLSDAEIKLPPATQDEMTGATVPTERRVYVSSDVEGAAGVLTTNHPFTVGLPGGPTSVVHAWAPRLTMEKKEYQGLPDAYEFNPITEQYERVASMHYGRWYPTLTTLPSGKVMAISGLDGAGAILDGEIETYDPATRKWTERPEFKRYFPTYPAIFSTTRDDRLFFAGPSTGWGPATKAREPGFWNLSRNTFTPVPGIRDPHLLETGSAAWLGPVNDQRLVVVGGGGVGDSLESTRRIDVVDLKSRKPHFTPLTDLENPTRYPNLVNLPSGDLLITNGAEKYRGMFSSDLHKAYILGQDGKLRKIAAPKVGRNYHSTAMLLPDGQILTTGSDPLFSDAKNQKPGKFDQRFEIFTPPEYFQAQQKGLQRPLLERGPKTLSLGSTGVFTLKGRDAPAKITSVRMMVPASVTHITDTNQRSVDVKFTQSGNEVTVTMPTDPALMPLGNYMVFLNDDQGQHSVAHWLRVTKSVEEQ